MCYVTRYTIMLAADPETGAEEEFVKMDGKNVIEVNLVQ